MELIKDRTFKGDTLQIDNRIFIDCLLINCTLEYEGGAVSFKQTQMRGCQYVFFGRAKRTVHFLQGVGLMPYMPAEWAEFSELVH